MHPGLRDGAAGHHDDGVRAGRDHRPDGGERQVEVGQDAVEAAHGQAVEPVAPPRHHHPPVVEHGVAGGAEHPGRHADVGVGAHHGLDVVAGLPAVEVPPVGAVGEEPQRAVGPPPRLGDRLDRTARDDGLLPGGEIADDQLGGVPRHRRVVPLQPRERGAVRRHPRRRHEVRSADEDLRLARNPGVEHDDLVDDVDRAVAEVPLADADDPRAVRAELPVGVAVAPRPGRLGGERLGRALGLEAVQALVGPVGEPQHAVAHPPGGTAVLVHGRPRVASLGEQLVRGPVGTAPDQLRPPALRRAALGPHDVARRPPAPRRDGRRPPRRPRTSPGWSTSRRAR